MNTRGAAAQAKTQARKAAQDLLQARMQPITRLAELGVAVERAHAESETARDRWRTEQEAYAEGYRAAREAGWSPAELEAIGCGTQPAGAALRATPRRSDADSAVTDSASEHDDTYSTAAAGDVPEPTDLDLDRIGTEQSTPAPQP